MAACSPGLCAAGPIPIDVFGLTAGTDEGSSGVQRIHLMIDPVRGELPSRCPDGVGLIIYLHFEKYLQLLAISKAVPFLNQSSFEIL